MIRDAKIDEQAKKFLEYRPRTYQAQTTQELQAQLNGVADMLVGVVTERDKFIKAASAGETAKLWAKILVAAVLAEGFVIGFLATQLFDRLK